MGKIDNFYVQFDEKWGLYRPGQKVTGQAILKLNDNIASCRKVIAYFHGSARVLWIETVAANHTAYLSELTFFNDKSILWSSDQQQKDEKTSTTTILEAHQEETGEQQQQKSYQEGLPAGEHVFTFHYTLPANLATSFEVLHSPGYVRYSVKICVVDKNEIIKFARKSHFIVVQPVDLNNFSYSSHLSKTFENIYVKDLTKCKTTKKVDKLQLFSNKRTEAILTVKIKVPKLGYVPGERVEFEATIKNTSSLILVKTLKAHLVQIVTAFSQKPEYKMREATKNLSTAASYGCKIGKGKSRRIVGDFTWNVKNLYVPAVAPNFCIEGILDVRYVLKLELLMDKDSRASIFNVEVPLTIGTVPLANRETYFVTTSSLMADSSLINQSLPAYDNFAMDIPPPTYEESLIGICNVDNDFYTCE